MKHPLTWLYILLGVLVVFLFVRATDWYQRTVDPTTYWAEKVARLSELLDGYIVDSKECDEQFAQLTRPDSRDLWVSQKKLEGMSPEEAIADYQSYVEINSFTCDFARKMVPEAAKDLEQAKAALQRASGH